MGDNWPRNPNIQTHLVNSGGSDRSLCPCSGFVVRWRPEAVLISVTE